MRFLTSELNLSYPPISNQHGEYLLDDEEVREYVKQSKLYMIAHREELIFHEPNILMQGFGVLTFKLKLGEILSPTIKVSIKFVFETMKNHMHRDDGIEIQIGEKFIRIVNEKTNDVLYWTTPDKFLFDYSRKSIDVEVDDNVDIRQFSTFELYYVGISKSGDSFSRLFDNAHHGRLRILSNESQKESSARLTDELMIFLFEIDSVNINSINDISEMDDLYHQSNEIAIVADAEKAFIKLMNTKYNKTKYKGYPNGVDGLFNSGLHRYGYSINEDITFKTDIIEFNGAWGYTEKKDLIIVEGDNIEIIQLYHS